MDGASVDAGGAATPVATGVLASLELSSGVATASGTAAGGSGAFAGAASAEDFSGFAFSVATAGDGVASPPGMAVSSASGAGGVSGKGCLPSGAAFGSVLTAGNEEPAAAVAPVA